MGDSRNKRLVVIVLTLVSSLVVGGQVKAANLPKTSYGITVSPATQQVSLVQSQNSTIFNTGIANNTPVSVVVNLSALDFTGLNQTGAINFLNPNQSQQSNSHGLASNLSFELPQFVLAPYQNMIVPVTINNANQLKLGGHYAAIIFKVSNAPVKGAVSNVVNINEAVSSLVFVSTSGSGTRSLALQYVSIGSLFTNFPTNVSVILADNGNTQTVPTGVIQIINSKNKIVSQTQINTTSNLILPEANRLFNFQLTSFKTRPTSGYYTFKFYYKTASQNAYHLYQKRFLYLSRQAVYLFIAIVILLLVLLVQKLSRKTYYKS